MPRPDTLKANLVAGWSVPAPSYYVNEGNRLTTVIQWYTYRKGENDLSVYWAPTATGTTVVPASYSLGTNSALANWTLTGGLAYPGDGEPGQNALELLDVAGKVIARINKSETFPNTPIYANNFLLLSVPTSGAYMKTVLQSVQPFSFSRAGTQVRINYLGYSVTVPVFESGADVSQPASVRPFFANPAGRNSGKQQDFANLKFYPQ